LSVFEVVRHTAYCLRHPRKPGLIAMQNLPWPIPYAKCGS